MLRHNYHNRMDRSKQMAVKIKDPSLNREMRHTLSNDRYEPIKWNNFYCDCILQNYTVLSKMKDHNGQCILHHVCHEDDVSDYVLFKMIETFPKLMNVRDDTGQTPLHIAINGQTDDVVIKMIALFAKDVVVQQESDVASLIITSITSGRNGQIVVTLMDLFPTVFEDVPIKDDYLVIPSLHLILCSKGLENEISKMLELYPPPVIKFLTCNCRYSMMCLHSAIVRMFPPEMDVSIHYTSGSYYNNSDTQYFHHFQLAIQLQLYETVVGMMTELSPSVIRVRYENGQYTLQFEIVYKDFHQMDLLFQLIEIFPKTFEVWDDDGRHPLCVGGMVPTIMPI